MSDDFTEMPSFRPSSTWTPVINDVHLEVYLSILEDELLSINEEGRNFSNLTKEEKEAIDSLSKDDSIVIKPGDKGSAIVIWNKDDYIQEAKRQLNQYTMVTR